MKAFIFSSALLALAVADTCSDCTAVVSTIAARLSSEESIAAQQGILVGGLCPGAEDPAECEAALPGLWAGIAALLWPGYWDPKVNGAHSRCIMSDVHMHSSCETAHSKQATWTS